MITYRQDKKLKWLTLLLFHFKALYLDPSLSLAGEVLGLHRGGGRVWPHWDPDQQALLALHPGFKTAKSHVSHSLLIPHPPPHHQVENTVDPVGSLIEIYKQTDNIILSRLVVIQVLRITTMTMRSLMRRNMNSSHSSFLDFSSYRPFCPMA